MTQKNIQLKNPLILASNSPRRKEILEKAGFSFQTLSFDFDENVQHPINIFEVSLAIALHKINQLTTFSEDTILICSDTVVINDNKILGKPTSNADAFQMLQSLRNKMHYVVTGVCIKTKNGLNCFSDTAKVYFGDLSDHEIERYIASGAATDKAGSYGIQDYIGLIGIEKIEGSYFTVMGLPIHLVYKELKPFMV